MLDLSLISLAQFYSSTPNGTEEAKCGHLVRIIDWEHNSDDNSQCKTVNKSILSIQIKSLSKNDTINYHLYLVPAQCLIIYRWNSPLINLCQVWKSDFCSLDINGFYILDSGKFKFEIRNEHLWSRIMLTIDIGPSRVEMSMPVW